uniref:Uncharacterized protein n=1 Tax=Solanum tuberosum TaxID=4113 RepID=M1DIE8_SOLTU
MAPHQAFALVLKEGQNKQKFDQAFPKSLSHLYQSFPMKNGLGEGVKNWFKEGDIVLEEMIETPVILDSESKEKMPNWTSTSLLIPRSSCENIFKSADNMSCHKLNEQNGVDADEFEDYNEMIMLPKHLVEEFRQFESHDEPNSEEIGIVNQENDERIKEIKIGAYLTKAHERELISLFKEHIDTFV